METKKVAIVNSEEDILNLIIHRGNCGGIACCFPENFDLVKRFSRNVIYHKKLHCPLRPCRRNTIKRGLDAREKLKEILEQKAKLKYLEEL
jgi:hypothetical protein